ncbi:MAG: chorismate synthase [Planctomycetes bacterium]|nr:chorismate synthase [Planctomycetota bacterium]
MLSYQTAGESHGPALLAVVNGVPRGLAIDEGFINRELERRQGGYGRGGRQNIETDTVQILSGVRAGVSMGSPITLMIANRDSRMDDLVKTPPISRPRPGHADLAGALKWLSNDCRETLERASARETAARVAAGALSRLLLREIGIEAFGLVRSIGGIQTNVTVDESSWRGLIAQRDASETYCPEASATQAQRDAIRQAKIDKDTIGGLVEAHVFGAPPGLGSCMNWHEKLDARLAYAVMGIQAIKSVEIGLGKEVASRPGSQVHDPITFDAARTGESTLGFVRPSNNAGGTEGGMTTGQPIVVRAAMKPIATLLRGMPSVDLKTKQPDQSAYERSDVCAVPACSVVVENVVAFEVARVACEKFGGDSVAEFVANFRSYLHLARQLR